jgi:hypothetical protein
LAEQARRRVRACEAEGARCDEQRYDAQFVDTHGAAWKTAREMGERGERITARRASIYESVWLALEQLASPMTPSQKNTLAQMRGSGHEELRDLADDIEQKALAPRTEPMDRAAKPAIGGYAWAIAFGVEMHLSDLDEVRSKLDAFRKSVATADAIIVKAAPPVGMANPSMRLSLKRVM